MVLMKICAHVASAGMASHSAYATSVRPRLWMARAALTSKLDPGMRKKSAGYLPAKTCGASCTNCRVQMTVGRDSAVITFIVDDCLPRLTKVNILAIRKFSGTTIIWRPRRNRLTSIPSGEYGDSSVSSA